MESENKNFWGKYNKLISVAVMVFLVVFGSAMRNTNNKSQQEKYNQHLNEYYQDIDNARANWKLGDYEKTISDAEEALKISKTDDEKSGAHYWKGVGLYKQKNLIEAKQEEELSIKLSPESVGPYVTMSAILADQNDLVKAEEFAKKAISIDQSYPWAYNSLALIYIQQGKNDLGILELEKAVKLDPVTFGPQLESVKEFLASQNR